jgi:hypothetical protein
MDATALTWFNAMTLKVAELEKGSARSVDWEQSLATVHFRVMCFAYHRDEYNRLVSEGLANSSAVESETAFIVAPIGEPDGEQLSINAALAAAQLLAAAQSLHAACDSLFRVAFLALGLDTKPHLLASGSLSAHEVSENAIGQSKVELDRLSSSTEYHYLDGFVQVSKHRNLLTARRKNITDSERESVGLSIREFQHADEASVCSFSAKWATDFLTVNCDKIIEQCNALGGVLAKEMV